MNWVNIYSAKNSLHFANFELSLLHTIFCTSTNVFFSVLENWKRTTLRMLHRSNRGRCRWKWRNQKSIYVQSALKTSSVLRNPLGFARVKIYAMTVGSWPVMIAGPFRGRWRQRWVTCASTSKSLHTSHI